MRADLLLSPAFEPHTMSSISIADSIIIIAYPASAVLGAMQGRNTVLRVPQEDPCAASSSRIQPFKDPAIRRTRLLEQPGQSLSSQHQTAAVVMRTRAIKYISAVVTNCINTMYKDLHKKI